MIKPRKELCLFLLQVFIYSNVSFSTGTISLKTEFSKKIPLANDHNEQEKEKEKKEYKAPPQEDHLHFRTNPLKLGLWILFFTIHYFLSFDVEWVGIHYGGDVCTDKHRHKLLPYVQTALSTYIAHHSPHMGLEDFTKDPAERAVSGITSRITADEEIRQYWFQGNYSFFDSLIESQNYREKKIIVDFSDEKSLSLKRGDILVASPLTFQIQSRLSLYLVQHWAVYLGQGFMMESDGSNYVWLSPLAKNQDYMVMRLTETSSQEDIMKRARQSLGKGPQFLGFYTPLFSNCQHFASWLATGKSRSPIAGAILLGYFGGNAVLLAIHKKYRRILFKRWRRMIRSHRWS